MTDTKQPEELRLANVCSNLTRYSMEAHLIAAELRRQHARIAELEAQLEAIGAGGVSGPLMGCASIAASAGSEPVANDRPSLEDVFRGLSDRAYCSYIEQMRRNECLGWEHKVKHGTFGEAELKAHTLAGRLLGRHHAFAEAANALRGSNAPLTHPSPPEGMVAEQALRKVLSVVQRYLPPDGPTAHDAMTEIIAIVDPWPLGPMEKS